MRRGEKEKEETQGQETDGEKMDKVGERGDEKGDTPQGSRVTKETRVKKKSSESDPL